MNVTVNGERRDAPDGCTVTELLALLEAVGPGLAVERNREVIPRAEHATTTLVEGDTLEVVTLVGGG
ncbi:MAG: sulfur carrier protein ThiS [Planctomycetota bacterium]